jgi:hypothetical protein
MVFLVPCEVLGELIDPRREQGNLHLGGSRVGRAPAILGDDLGFLRRFERHATILWGRPIQQPLTFDLFVEAAHHTETFGAAPSS